MTGFVRYATRVKSRLFVLTKPCPRERPPLLGSNEQGMALLLNHDSESPLHRGYTSTIESQKLGLALCDVLQHIRLPDCIIRLLEWKRNKVYRPQTRVLTATKAVVSNADYLSSKAPSPGLARGYRQHAEKERNRLDPSSRAARNSQFKARDILSTCLRTSWSIAVGSR